MASIAVANPSIDDTKFILVSIDGDGQEIENTQSDLEAGAETVYELKEGASLLIKVA